MKVPRFTLKQADKLFNSGYSKEKIIRMFRYFFSDYKNFDTFCRFIFPDAFFKPFSKCHWDMAKFLFTTKSEANAQPRGFGKSTLTGLGFVSHYIVYDKGIYIIYTSVNHMKSMQFLEPIRNEFKYNKLLNFIYGPFNIGKVTEQGTGKDREDVFDINNKTRVQALSFEKSIRGLKHGNYRPSLIILDDIEDDQRVLNPTLRIKDSDKLNRQIIPALDAEIGIYKFIGTILHFDSLLMNKIKVLGGSITKAETPDGKSTFPELFSKEKLMAIKKEIGPLSYQQEYLNEPVANETAIIQSEWVRQCFDENISYGDNTGFLMRTSGLDPAFSDRITADNAAIAGVGLNDYRELNKDGAITGKYTVFYAEWFHGWSIMRQLKKLQELNKKFKFDINGLEENSIKALSTEFFNTLDFNYILFWLGANDPSSQIKKSFDFQNKRHTIGKGNLINRLATRFWNKEIKLPYKTDEDKKKSNMILEECTSWARQEGKIVEAGIHPDMPIALAYALELLESNDTIIDF